MDIKRGASNLLLRTKSQELVNLHEEPQEFPILDGTQESGILGVCD